MQDGLMAGTCVFMILVLKMIIARKGEIRKYRLKNRRVYLSYSSSHVAPSFHNRSSDINGHFNGINAHYSSIFTVNR